VEELKETVRFKLLMAVFYQYSETNVMHFLFSLLRINGLYMFGALLAHTQEALQLVQPTDITRKQYTKRRLYSAS
jgi:hypothetical protein